MARALRWQRRRIFIFMFSTRIERLVKGSVLVSALAFGIVLFSTWTASAQNRDYRNDRGRYDRNNDRYNDNYRRNDRYNRRDRDSDRNTRSAYQRGYQDGLRQGMQDARGRRGNGHYNGGYGTYGNDGRYGNNNGWGNNSARQAYQSGFQRGYNEGLTRNRNNRNRNGSWWPF